MITLEDICRAITIADGVDPDAEGYGLGHSMPEGERYPLWRAREKQAQAVYRLLLDNHYMASDPSGLKASQR